MQRRKADWLDHDVALDPAAAAAIYEGMLTVARADGQIGELEMQLLIQFSDTLPEDSKPPDISQINTSELISVYLQALMMVALADGVITENERNVINRYAKFLGVSKEEVALRIVEVKRHFVYAMKSELFIDAVVMVAHDLGLTDEEIEKIASRVSD